jgi:DNA-binding response OmpR family regulator
MSQPRIIVIEDQEDLAELYETTLTEAGYEVFKAYTGEEGAAEFAANGADAILLDMTLPEMNGLQTLQEIRSTDTNVPVVVATGESSAETRTQCERLGVQDYLAKPVRHERLLAAFRHAFEDMKTTTEEYEVVTLRLPTRIIKCLSSVHPNLERAVSLVCEEKFGG